MRKILFLDIDGVLNISGKTYITAMHQEGLMERHLVQRFNYLVSHVKDIEIVISSSWRTNMDDLKDELEKSGFLYWDKVIGRTAVDFISSAQKRGLQIQRWIDENVVSIPGTFVSGVDAHIAILDDELFDLHKVFEQKDLFILDPSSGLDEKTVLEICYKFRE